MANYTQEMISVNNSVIIGQTQTNVEIDASNYTGMAAFITPRSGRINITNTRLYNYPINTIAIVTCSQCYSPILFTNIGS